MSSAKFTTCLIIRKFTEEIEQKQHAKIPHKIRFF